MPRNSAVERCIEDCRDCHGVCVETIAHCLSMGGRHAEAKHITLMRDCAEMCHLSEDSILRSSEFMHRICRLCADVCVSCAESCEAFPDDEAMVLCAERCRTCADSCRQMSAPLEEAGRRLTSFS